jgi:hypothetical protein
MKDQKTTLFLLQLSFLGWLLAALLSQLWLSDISSVLGLVVSQGIQLYMITYMNAAVASFYLAVSVPGGTAAARAEANAWIAGLRGGSPATGGTSTAGSTPTTKSWRTKSRTTKPGRTTARGRTTIPGRSRNGDSSAGAPGGGGVEYDVVQTHRVETEPKEKAYPPLQTERLVLRMFELGDTVDVYDYAQSPIVGPMAGWTPHRSIEDSRRVVHQFINHGDVWAIVEKKSGRVIGSVGLHVDSRRDVENVCMLGMLWAKSSGARATPPRRRAPYSASPLRTCAARW